MSNLITRSPSVIAEEINTIKTQTSGILTAAFTYAKRSCFEIGKRLEEAKALVPHGEWALWLEENFEYSESTAGNFMRIYREFGDEQINLLTGKSDAETFEGFSQSQLVELFALPKEMRAEFVEEHRQELESGELSVREMRDLIKKQKDLIALKDREILIAEGERKRLNDAIIAAEQNAKNAQNDLDDLTQQTLAIQVELDQLKTEPKEAVTMVKTEKVYEPSDEQIEQIRAEVLAQAEEKHKNDIECLSAEIKERDENHTKQMQEAQDQAAKKLRQLAQKADPHASRVSYCMEAINRAINDINSEVALMDQEAPGSGAKMRMRCESTLLGILNKYGWQV